MRGLGTLLVRTHALVALALLALSLAWPSSIAWAYGARLAEIRNELTRLGLPEEEREALTEAAEAYISFRNHCLDELLAIVDDDRNDEHESAWARRAADCRRGAADIFSDAFEPLDDVDEVSGLAFATRGKLAAVEDAFLAGAAGLGVAGNRDRIIAIAVQLEEKIDDLQRKWSRYRSTASSIGRQRLATGQEIRTILDRAIDDAARRNTTAAEEVRALVARVGQTPPPLPSDLAQQALTAIGHVAQVVDAMDTRVAERKRRYASYVNNKSSLLIVFAETRAEVDAFLDETNFQLAEQEYDAAARALNRFTSGTATSGQRRDAEDFRDDLRRALGGHIDTAERRYRDFVRDNEDLFFGPVGPQVREELLSLRSWERLERELRGLSIDARLREWRNHASGYFGVSMTGLEPEQRRWIEAQLGRDLDALADAISRSQRRLESRLETLLDRSALVENLD